MCGQVFTGRDNETVAWGRVMGALVFALFVILGPPIALFLVAIRRISAADLVLIMNALAVYVPGICVAAAALIAGTAFAEPKPKDPAQ